MQTHRWRYTTFEFLAWNVGETGDENYLHIRIEFADLAAGLNTVDARRHAHIQDHYIERVTVIRCLFCETDRIVTLSTGNNVEFRRVLDIGFLIK